MTMMNSHFNLIKQRVSVADACRMYGIELNRAKKARCPFHSEKEGSFSVKNDMWHCFGCGAGGDVITLVQKLFNLTPYEALEKLNYDFHTGLDLEHKPERQEVIRHRQDQKLKEQFNKWVKNAFDVLSTYFRELHFASQDPKHPMFYEALQQISKIDYFLECLEANPLEFYKAYKGAVKDIERKRRGIERSRLQAI